MAVGIVAIATAISSLPSFAASGPVGGPIGDGAAPRVVLGGGVAGGGVAGLDDVPLGDISVGADLGAAAGIERATIGTSLTALAPDDRVGTVSGLLEDGTLLKPVAVDTTVSDGKALLRTYRVRSGDTLTGIARKHGVSMMTVWWANNLTAKDDLHIGQILTIPPVSGLIVTVGPSDTLETLAAKYAIDPTSIVDANQLDDPNLVIGQTLTMPGALGAGIATPTPKPVVKSTAGGSGGSSGGSARPPATYTGGAFAWPVAGGYISQYYHYGHYGIDIAADYGTRVKAAAGGTVIFSGWKSNGGGYQVWIAHGSGLYTTYNHMSGVSVGKGQKVGKGQQVGRIGQSGYATGPHLHFEVWKGMIWDGGRRVNPLGYL